MRVEKHGISDEQIEKNSLVIAKLEKGMTVSVDCYCAFHDVIKQGILGEISTAFKYIKLNGEKIAFDDIYSISILDMPK